MTFDVELAKAVTGKLGGKLDVFLKTGRNLDQASGLVIKSTKMGYRADITSALPVQVMERSSSIFDA